MSEQEHVAAGGIDQQAGDSVEGEAAIHELARHRRHPVLIGATGLSFSHALVLMRHGHRVRRAGWNGKGMWICQGQGNIMDDPSKFWNEHTRKYAEQRMQQGLPTEVLPYIIMKTADHKILMGWLASQSDMLADDWELVE